MAPLVVPAIFIRSSISRLISAFTILLDGRTGHVTVRTEDAAIAFERAKQLAAAFTVIEKLTGLRGHLFFFSVAALRASQR